MAAFGLVGTERWRFAPCRRHAFSAPGGGSCFLALRGGGSHPAASMPSAPPVEASFGNVLKRAHDHPDRCAQCLSGCFLWQCVVDADQAVVVAWQHLVWALPREVAQAEAALATHQQEHWIGSSWSAPTAASQQQRSNSSSWRSASSWSAGPERAWRQSWWDSQRS